MTQKHEFTKIIKSFSSFYQGNYCCNEFPFQGSRRLTDSWPRSVQFLQAWLDGRFRLQCDPRSAGSASIAFGNASIENCIGLWYYRYSEIAPLNWNQWWPLFTVWLLHIYVSAPDMEISSFKRSKAWRCWSLKEKARCKQREELSQLQPLGQPFQRSNPATNLTRTTKQHTVHTLFLPSISVLKTASHVHLAGAFVLQKSSGVCLLLYAEIMHNINVFSAKPVGYTGTPFASKLPLVQPQWSTAVPGGRSKEQLPIC